MKWSAAKSNELSEINEIQLIEQMAQNIKEKIWREIVSEIDRGHYKAFIKLDFKTMYRPEMAEELTEKYLNLLEENGYITSLEFAPKHTHDVTVEW